MTKMHPSRSAVAFSNMTINKSASNIVDLSGVWDPLETSSKDADDTTGSEEINVNEDDDLTDDASGSSFCFSPQDKTVYISSKNLPPKKDGDSSSAHNLNTAPFTDIGTGNYGSSSELDKTSGNLSASPDTPPPDEFPTHPPSLTQQPAPSSSGSSRSARVKASFFKFHNIYKIKI